MPALVAPLIGGIVGTVVMTVFLFMPRWLNLGRVDVVRAVGALFTGKAEGAEPIGFTLHFASGIVFAYVYYFAIQAFQLPVNWLTYLLAGALHGVIVMLLVSIAVLEHHPVARYHERGPMTGFMQLLAHIVYGGVTGLVVQAIT